MEMLATAAPLKFACAAVRECTAAHQLRTLREDNAVASCAVLRVAAALDAADPDAAMSHW
jgi:hypothetical protein